MEEYRHHIKHPLNKNKSICNTDISNEFSYIDINHAFLTREQKQYHLVCNECSKKIFETLNNED